MVFGIELWAALGFAFAAYAVVGNDALQTLGTFINSNRQLHWTILFAFAALILVLTFAYGWHVNNGDPSYGRLANEVKYPPITIEWYHTLPPLVLLFITRLGIPVSTSFMVLTIFATGAGLASMLEKSLIGYAVAFVTGGVIYALLSQTLERWFNKSELGATAPRGLIAIIGSSYLVLSQLLLAIKDDRDAGGSTGIGELASGLFTDNGTLLGLIGLVFAIEIVANLISRSDKRYYWVAMQWVTTGYLWSVWLIQDFANIFVFLPRELTALEGFSAMMVILVLLGITFANDGGPVQRILKTKSNVTDIRSATIIDFIYASLLFFFKEYSDIPMSTTWVFLGLIAGREYAFALTTKAIRFGLTLIDATEDVAKAFIGIVISIDLAVGLPFIAQLASGETGGALFASSAFAIFVAVANVAMFPIMVFAFSKPEDHPHEGTGKVRWAVVVMAALLGLTALFFTFKDSLGA